MNSQHLAGRNVSSGKQILSQSLTTEHYWRAADVLWAPSSFGEPALVLAIRYTCLSRVLSSSLKSLAKHLWFPTESWNRESP